MWKKIDSLNSRSTSFPHMRRNQNHHHHNNKNRNNNDNDNINNHDDANNNRKGGRTPSLISAMLKLYDVLDDFCEHIQDATYGNAQTACLLLDTALVASLSSASALSVPNSPAAADPAAAAAPSSITSAMYRSTHSPGAQRSASASPSTRSPSRSPVRSPAITWFIGYNSEEEAIATAQKREWDELINPLIIFAGIEANYSACTHMKSFVHSNHLIKLFERTRDDLCHVKDIICDPLVYSTNNDSTSMLVPGCSVVSSYMEKARKLAETFNSLMVICDCRSKLITIQKNFTMSSTEKFDVENIVGCLQAILINLPTTDITAKSSTPIMKNLSKEISCWSNLLNISFFLMKLKYTNTIVCCQKAKMNLNFESSTHINKWMKNIYQSYLSILPVYFDWVNSNVFLRYNFSSRSFDDGKIKIDKVLEKKVEDYLAKRKNIPFAVAVICSEHGLSTVGQQESSIMNKSLIQDQNIIFDYPAIYMRSNTTVQNPSRNKIMGKRRNSGSKNGTLNTVSETEKEWPYSSWTSIIPYLNGSCTLMPGKESSGEIQWSQIDSDTLVYALPINKQGMWLLAMRKRFDDNRWSRRNIDEQPGKEDRKFFREFSSALTLRTVLKLNLEVDRLEEDSLIGKTLKQEELFIDYNNTSTQVVDSIKAELSLRSPSSKAYKLPLRKQGAKQERRPIKRLNKNSNNSHYDFFLGNLMDTLNG